jgi:eukaryotic-like serine/threonine-protein kinase
VQTKMSPMNHSKPEHRLRCPACLAVFRTGFDCCPGDGTALVPSPPGTDPLIGSELAGRYVIEGLVGEGSMGIIYRARHVRLPRHFAVKVLFGDLVADQRMRIRFAQEASLASRLSHPNVVSVVDFGRSDAGLLYLVMNLIEGETLSELIAREAPLDTAHAIRLTRQLAQGLGHAHENGLVHRDFKPGNVVLERQDGGPAVPRILDFGLAISTREREEAHGGDELAGRLTECGLIVGTPIYIAPEQALDHAVDHRADLFALGVVLYEMLAGKPPFDGSPVEIAHKNVTEPVPPIARRSPGLAVPAELEQVARRLLAKSPNDRYGSAAELCAALDAVERGAVEAMTLGMRAAIYNGEDDDGLPDVDELARRRRNKPRRLAVVGSLLFAAGALAYAMADRAGLVALPSFDDPMPVAAAAVEPRSAEAPSGAKMVEGSAELASAREPTSAQVAATGEAANPEAAAAETAAAEAVVAEAATAEPAADESANAAEASPSAEASAAKRPSERRASVAAAKAKQFRAARSSSFQVERRPESFDPTALAQAPVDRGPTQRFDAGPQRRMDPSLVEPSVDRLIRDYREVGEALARLQSRGGEQAARVFRDRYFRLPYGDALRIPSMRRDTLAQLSALRHDVMDAIQTLSSGPQSITTR